MSRLRNSRQLASASQTSPTGLSGANSSSEQPNKRFGSYPKMLCNARLQAIILPLRGLTQMETSKLCSNTARKKSFRLFFSCDRLNLMICDETVPE